MSRVGNRVESPCVRNCCLNEADICLGCFRSIAEITRWTEMDDVERRHILRMANDRKTVHDAVMKEWRD